MRVGWLAGWICALQNKRIKIPSYKSTCINFNTRKYQGKSPEIAAYRFIGRCNDFDGSQFRCPAIRNFNIHPQDHNNCYLILKRSDLYVMCDDDDINVI